MVRTESCRIAITSISDFRMRAPDTTLTHRNIVSAESRHHTGQLQLKVETRIITTLAEAAGDKDLPNASQRHLCARLLRRVTGITPNVPAARTHEV